MLGTIGQHKIYQCDVGSRRARFHVDPIVIVLTARPLRDPTFGRLLLPTVILQDSKGFQSFFGRNKNECASQMKAHQWLICSTMGCADLERHATVR